MSYTFLLFGIIVAISLMACVGKVEEQAPDVQWHRAFGYGGNVRGGSVQQTTDGGYIVCGIKETPGEEGVFLIKTDARGNKLWDNTFAGEVTAIGLSIQQITDDDYILCGNTESSLTAIGFSVQQTTDGGYILCGNMESSGDNNTDIWLIKTDAKGNRIWDKAFGGNKDDISNAVQQTTDGGYIVCGNTESYGAGNSDIWLIKTDADGNKLWDKTFGGEEYDEGRSVQETADGGYILCGITKPYGDRDEYSKLLSFSRLVKTDIEGNKIWEKTFGIKPEQLAIEPEQFANYSAPNGYMVQQTTDGGYIICGNILHIFYVSDLRGLSEKILLLRTDTNGNKLWDKMFSSRPPWGGVAFGYSVQQTTDGGYVICGTNSSLPGYGINIWLIKTDANGNKLWDGEFGNNWCSGNSIQQTMDGGYIVSGTIYRTLDTGESFDVLLLKIDPEQ
jgi:hypothetical protein